MSEETPNRPVDSLLGVPRGRLPSSSGRGTAPASFVGEAGYPPHPLRQVMGTVDCQFPPAVEPQEVAEVPRAWASPKGKLGNSEDVNAGGMSPTLHDRNSML